MNEQAQSNLPHQIVQSWVHNKILTLFSDVTVNKPKYFLALLIVLTDEIRGLNA